MFVEQGEKPDRPPCDLIGCLWRRKLDSLLDELVEGVEKRIAGRKVAVDCAQGYARPLSETGYAEVVQPRVGKLLGERLENELAGLFDLAVAEGADVRTRLSSWHGLCFHGSHHVTNK